MKTIEINPNLERISRSDELPREATTILAYDDVSISPKAAGKYAKRKLKPTLPKSGSFTKPTKAGRMGRTRTN